MLRRLAADTVGVVYIGGQRVIGLVGDGGRAEGVEVEMSGGRRRTIRARLIVAADGRDSTVARLAGVPARVGANNRFVYFAYWHGVETPADEARVWFLNPDAAAVFPNEDGVCVIAVVPHKSRLPEFRADPEAAYLRAIRRLPDGPGIEDAERVSKLIGKIEMANKIRPAGHRGLAFIGDAGLATDPLFGVGCGWAFQSAEWLAESVSSPLLSGSRRPLDKAVRRYARRLLLRLGPHHLQIADYSTGRPLRWNERAFFRAASTDPVVGAALEEFVTRRAGPLRLLDAGLLTRLLGLS
jgi:2-polyprenyl-6-methoxyphenol hydroxylase-like FAD-dependent oxidoreductase